MPGNEREMGEKNTTTFTRATKKKLALTKPREVHFGGARPRKGKTKTTPEIKF